MSFHLNELEVLALAVSVVTCWLLTMRGRIPVESNWPLVYYLGMVFYSKTGGAYLDAGFIYAGVIFAMLIRFEFLSAGFIKFFRVLEGICLAYVVWRTLDFALFH